MAAASRCHRAGTRVTHVVAGCDGRRGRVLPRIDTARQIASAWRVAICAIDPVCWIRRVSAG
ncbi:hypothetical protein CEK64_09395 [Xanthomonas sontii]|nr:hypothetical protein CEK64_09395 [Xanthomonas sontii]